MVHGEQQLNQSTSSFENILGPDQGGESSQAVVATVDLTTSEAKERVIGRVEREMDIFRKGECSRFQAASRVTKELEKWEGASDRDKGKALDSYLNEINSFAAIQDEDRSNTREASPPLGMSVLAEQQSAKKRIREEVEELLEQVSGGEFEGEGEEVERRIIRKRAKEEDMPWYNVASSASRRSSCVETCRILLQFSEDLPGVKSLLRVADNLPEGIPPSQWGTNSQRRVSPP